MLDIGKMVSNFEYNGYFLDKSDLGDLLDGLDFESRDELVAYLDDEDGNYIGDRISELADSRVSPYYWTLREWAVDNYGYIEDAIEEFGAPNPFDFHKAIQIGQYKAYSDEFYELKEEFKNFVEEFEEEVWE